MYQERHQNSRIVSEGNRHCPICGAVMQIVYPENVQIDCCPEHGVWLDNGELEKIIFKVREKFQHKADAQIAKSNHDGKVAGVFWGWLSLLFNSNPVDIDDE